ncbi:hypothetical protein PsorP6_011506 [Peronosclerospora sorghi]|uniref:Uncharacterized protein n=1 Tax=Peronosclerospora sorghi TaxID=230839 RepID=A0ACC0WJK4_9STRA|nr:hypothetical protein PsorP6_011506 [Peronosclerospora sorghi]
MTSTATIVHPQSCCSARAKLYRRDRCILVPHDSRDRYTCDSNNKFYMGQLILDRSEFVVFRKWGRIGAKLPQSQTQHFDSLENAQLAFQRVFRAKSGNSWPLAEPFVHKKGKYFM